ncbi:MAG: ImmA/IrrE family metallo-endopeptidase [Bifidobacterium sp.]|nr:ImmA/IrrE family metallo-endopeptidase [Bifidobacterium sp.]
MVGLGELFDEAESLGLHVEERPLRNGLCGFYFDRMRTVVIDGNMLEFQKRCTLCHELAHARYLDANCRGTAETKTELRARRYTALRLIDQVEYASAENVYEGDVYLIACELDVTLQVINDYQRLALPRLVGDFDV